MNGVVLAAGRGRRLNPLTETKPKAMVEVGGVPLLSHCLENLVSAGVSKIVIVTGYLGRQIRKFYGKEFRGIPITYRTQQHQLGMAHALLAAESAVTNDFMLLNGDHIIPTNLRKLTQQHQKNGVDGTILVHEVSSDTAKEETICEVTDDGTITRIIHQPDDPPDKSFAVAGCQTYPAAAFDASRLVRPSDRDEYELTDTLKILLTSGWRLVAVEAHNQPVNVNTMVDLEDARRLVCSR